jgi:hypothetical protein
MELTPTQLSMKPKVMSINVQDYDFEKQNRGPLMAGSLTSSSLQTFDNKGKPKDSRSDKND